MYEPVSHTALNQILDELRPEIRKNELRFFYSRLGANFYVIHSLFHRLYGARPDFDRQLRNLVEVMARNYIQRSDELKIKDREREADHNWFLQPNWVGMALYADGFSDNLAGMQKHINYFSELGINFVHILPILKCPAGKSDGGYAVSDYREVDSRVGSNQDLQAVIQALHQRDSLIVLDIVVNHTSEEHDWARRAASGDPHYQDYYYMFENRDIPDMFEQSMPEVFPETDPGNFTWNEDARKWVMTVFHKYQWDLNYTNPAVFIEMLDIMFFWANQGVDVLRLDAVAFLWKKIGTICQNEREAHLVLQLFKDCCQVVAPGLLFIAEAIVAPIELIKYFGEDAVEAKECEIAYNATFMALLWDAVATKNTQLLKQGLKSLPGKLERATWLNYLRCHDDIGFGFDNQDISAVGYNPRDHRRFLVDYFTGEFENSLACGKPFARDRHTGEARVSGSLASLVGLEKALAENDPEAIETCLRHIVLLHSVIMSFGGIPLLYYGDELGTLNDYSYLEDERKEADSRWMHRPRMDWDKAARRQQPGTIEYRLFHELRKMISIRKETRAFADFNNRELIELPEEFCFAFLRYDVQNPTDKVLVVANFANTPQHLPLRAISQSAHVDPNRLFDLWSGKAPTQISDHLVLSGFQFYWLVLR